MTQRMITIAYIALFVGTGFLALVGVFSDHTGLFDMASESFKVVVGAVVGALSSRAVSQG